MKHLLTMEQLSEKEILSILELADQLKYERKHEALSIMKEVFE